MMPKGKTTVTIVHVPLVSLCAACLLAAAVSQTPVLMGSAQAAGAVGGVANPYTISIPSELSVGADGTGTMSITGTVGANHRLTVTASSANTGKLSGPASDVVVYDLAGTSFTVSAHDTDVSIDKTVTATVTGSPRYQGTYTDTLTFTMSCVETHTLALDLRGGSLTDGWENPKELLAGESYNLPTPTRDGYTFSGWYTAASDGVQVAADTQMGDANVTLYAHWTEHVLTINYHSGYANRWQNYSHNTWVDLDSSVDCIVETERVGYDAVYPHPPYGLLNVSRLRKDGYHSANASGASDANGVWRINSPDSARTVSAADRPGSPVGSDVAGWIGVLDAFKAGNVTVDLYPILAPNTYYVRYNANGGTGTMEQTVHKYDDPTALRKNAFTKEGYTFVGWSESASGPVQYTDGQAINRVTSPGDGVTLYAQWQKNAESDEPSNDETQAASSQIDAVVTAKDSSASDVSPSSDAATGSVSAGGADVSSAQKPADTSGDAGTDAGDAADGSAGDDASEQPGTDASTMSPAADSEAPSSGEGAADGTQSAATDAGEDGTTRGDDGEAAANGDDYVAKDASSAVASAGDETASEQESDAVSGEEPIADNSEVASVQRLLEDGPVDETMPNAPTALLIAMREDDGELSCVKDGR